MSAIPNFFEWGDREIVVNSSDRAIPIFLFDLDKISPAVGLSLMASEVKVGLGMVEANATGSFTEIGDGWYWYIPGNSEMGTPGFISVRVSKPRIYPAIAVASITGSASDPVQPASGGVNVPSFGFNTGWLGIR